MKLILTAIKIERCRMQRLVLYFCVLDLVRIHSFHIDYDESSVSSEGEVDADKWKALRADDFRINGHPSECSDDDRNEPSTTKVSTRSDSIFKSFVLSYIHMLSTALRGKQLKTCLRLLLSELEILEFKVTAKLAKAIKRLLKLDSDEIKTELETLKYELAEEKPARREFFTAIDEVFTLYENNLFNDYIHDLEEYGRRTKISVAEETRRIVHDVIIKSIFKFKSTDERRQLEKKLQRAIKEFKN